MPRQIKITVPNYCQECRFLIESDMYFYCVAFNQDVYDKPCKACLDALIN